MRFSLLLSFIIAYLSPLQVGLASDAQNAFEKAEKAYQAGNYSEAAATYQSAPSPNQSALLYNLATTEWKMGAQGKALALMMNANHLSPFDGDIAYNLSYMRNQLSAEAKAIEPKAPILSFLPSAMRLSDGAWIFLALLCVAAILFKSLRSSKDAALFSISLASLAFIFLLLAGSSYIDRQEKLGVVIAKNITLRSGPGQSFQELTNLAEGSTVSIEDTKDNWMKLAFTIPKEKNREVVGWAELPTIFPVE